MDSWIEPPFENAAEEDPNDAPVARHSFSSSSRKAVSSDSDVVDSDDEDEKRSSPRPSQPLRTRKRKPAAASAESEREGGRKRTRRKAARDKGEGEVAGPAKGLYTSVPVDPVMNLASFKGGTDKKRKCFECKRKPGPPIEGLQVRQGLLCLYAEYGRRDRQEFAEMIKKYVDTEYRADNPEIEEWPIEEILEHFTFHGGVPELNIMSQECNDMDRQLMLYKKTKLQEYNPVTDQVEPVACKEYIQFLQTRIKLGKYRNSLAGK